MQELKHIIKTCPICGKDSNITITASEYIRWKNGMTIQEAMPKQLQQVRETLISGICSICQDSLFDISK